MTATARKSTTAPVRSVTGTGVHTGQPVRLYVRLAPAGTGIVFVRDGTTLRADLANVTATDRRVQLGAGDVTIDTVEHFLAACYGLGLDDLLVEVDGPELPIGDGSARHFVDLLAPLKEHIESHYVDPPAMPLASTPSTSIAASRSS